MADAGRAVRAGGSKDRRRGRNVLALVVALVGMVAILPAPPAGTGTGGGRPSPVVALVSNPRGLSVRRFRPTTTNARERLVQRLVVDHSVVALDTDRKVRALGTPYDGDPLRAQQWGLGAIRAEAPWGPHRADGQVVAVLDTGVDASHPDFCLDRISPCPPGRRLVLPGTDLVGGGDGTIDPHGHGTMVAGVIAAVGGNGVGIAGLAPGVRILPVRVLGADGTGASGTVAQGITWAVQHGATIINLSLGMSDPDDVVRAAVDDALRRGVVVVSAAGNEGDQGDPPSYPAAYDEVTAVGAVDSAGQVPSFSNRGSYVDLSAPASTWCRPTPATVTPA